MLTRKTAGTFFIILEICASFDKNYCKFDSFLASIFLQDQKHKEQPKCLFLQCTSQLPVCDMIHRGSE